MYILIAIIYSILDILWISLSYNLFYKDMIISIQNSDVIKFHMIYAICAYILLILSLLFVCIPLYNYHKEHKILKSFTLIGLIVYGVYNFTNAAILKGYPKHIILIDILWGCTIFTIMGFITQYLKNNSQ